MPQLSTTQKILILAVVLCLIAAVGLLWWTGVGPFGNSDNTNQANTNTTGGITGGNTRLNDTSTVPDADGDGLSDADESSAGSDVQKPDTDGDGLDDFQEVKVYKTSPSTADTDGDGIGDGREVEQQTNPNGSGPLLDTRTAIDALTNTAGQ